MKLFEFAVLLPYRLVNRGCKLVGSGSAVPSLQISNDDLAKFVETSDEWISVRTGIRNRRVLAGDFPMYSLEQLVVQFLSSAVTTQDLRGRHNFNSVSFIDL